MNDDDINVENENESETEIENESESYSIDEINELAESFEFNDLQAVESESPSNSVNLLSENFNYNLVFLGLLLILLVSNLVKEY